ncbi:hypothetical protein OIDMADRAFT_21314 [Oidiodendron maius Zn]|uniref:Uncharacterized protein n=1 Tax=Oidiodendron maius (strain Zn) TaxID=913774 RepID=A0A0C3CZQ1_OIDMZ|nr:hypothetical protein OIDMADRAFT_21314 [Oidiodendron maius Zn]
MLLSYPRLAELRTFVAPFSHCKLFFSSHERVVENSTINEFRFWRAHKYILIAGYEMRTVSSCGGIPPISPKRLVRIAIRDHPMVTLKFGVDNDNWREATRPIGRTRIAFMEDMNECVFEHGASNLQNECQW